MVDFHTHILPGMDDGAQDVEVAAKMLLLSKTQGVDTIVATPHFNASMESLESFLERRDKCFRELVAYVEENGLDVPKIVLGAEVAFCKEVLYLDIKKLCIENTDAVLIELPFVFLNGWIYNELYRISMEYKIDIILAHVERYVGVRDDFSMIEPFFDLDMYIQVNAESFIDRRMKKTMRKMIKEKRIDLLGTDCHNLKKRSPNMDKAYKYIEKKYGEHLIKKIEQNSEKILSK